MKRIYEPAAYAPLTGCWWSETETPPDWPVLMGDTQTEVAVIGGGFTGLVAALRLAQAGVGVTLLEAGSPGFGASGRNGGFCCLGGAKASRAQILRRVGPEGLRAWRQTEMAAVDTVSGLIDEFSMQVDRHSKGETLLAHTAGAWAAMAKSVDEIRSDYGLDPVLTPKAALREAGLGGPFHGALTLPKGFALNPRKYHNGLARAALEAGVVCHAQTAVRGLTRSSGQWRLRTRHGTVSADRVILATNGYSSEDVPPWLRARYLPVQSSVLVTRPISPEEQAAQGWTSAQMAFDSRFLLHYFRLMPDGRFLFGMRGGLRATPRAEAAIRRRILADFHTMFPGWQGVEITHHWSGLVCLMRGLVPYCGPVPGMPGVFAGLGYHGNGVAMGSHVGRLLGDLVRDVAPDTAYPDLIRAVPGRFPFGSLRRWLLAPAYALAALGDR